MLSVWEMRLGRKKESTPGFQGRVSDRLVNGQCVMFTIKPVFLGVEGTYCCDYLNRENKQEEKKANLSFFLAD